MRRFARLTRLGKPCYVDPALVGSIVVSNEHPGRTTLLQRGYGPNEYGTVMDNVDEPPDEVYRRLAAAASVVTKEQVAEVDTVLENAVCLTVTNLKEAREAMFGAVSTTHAENILRSALDPLRVALRQIKKTTLAALWAAEGEEPPK